MKKGASILFLILLSYQFCSAQGWVKKAYFYSNALNRAASFSIPTLGKGYVIGGYDNDYEKNAWCYDTLLNIWSPIAAFPGARSAQVAFSINGVGYVGTGTGPNYSYDSTFWKYDPSLNKWTKLAHFPGAPRAFAFGFSVNGKGYIGGGCDGLPGSAHALHDFYQYDPGSNTWSTVHSYPGHGCVGSVSFCIGSNGYVCTGDSITDVDFTKVTTADFYEYNPTGNTWTQKTSYSGDPGRGEAMGFATCGKGYICCGYSDGGQSTFLSDLYEYDAISDVWTHNTGANFGGGTRAYGSAFSIGSVGFVGLGRPDANMANNNDWWEYISPYPVPPLVILPLNPATCNATPITLKVQSEGSDFVWSPSLALDATTGDSVHFLAYSISDTSFDYTVTGVDSLGCLATGHDTVTVYPGPNKPKIAIVDTINITGSDDTTFELISSATEGNQWFIDNTLIDGATNQTLTVNSTPRHWYHVIVINPANGCSISSDTISASVEQSIPAWQASTLCDLIISAPTDDFILNEWPPGMLPERKEITSGCDINSRKYFI